MVKFEKRLVPESVVKQRSYGRGNPTDYVIVHQTGNTNRGANAEMHARLQSRVNPRSASWHEQVDDKQAIQSFGDDVQCWAAGDGRGPGNTRGYQIEICINSDGDYKKAVDNGAKRAAAKLKEHKLGIGRLKQHADFSSKNCPAQLRAGKDGISWSDFVKKVEAYMQPKPTKPSKDNLYRVQTGAFSVRQNAISLSNKLIKEGFETFIINTGGLYKVQVGAYAEKSNADAMSAKLDKKGYSNFITTNSIGEAAPSKPTPKPKPKAPAEKLTVDGLWGAATTRALQRVLKTPADGLISGQYSNSTTKSIYSLKFGPAYTGSLLVKAIQKKVGVSQDGFIGPATVRAMQRYLKTPADGVISKPSTMVKQLQRRLNAGTF